MPASQKRVIVVNAAPRMTKGNTQIMLDPFLEGLREAGAGVEEVLLGKMNINPCLGCFTCYAVTPGKCVHSDDMPELIERLVGADLLVLATPVYLDGMTSLAKIFIDRLVPVLDPHFAEDEKGLVHPLRFRFPENLFLVSVCGYPGVFNFDPLILHIQRIARNLHSNFSGALLRPAAFSLLLKKKYPERVKAVMDAVKKAGAQLARNATVSDETLSEAAADICSPRELMETTNAYWDRMLEQSRNRKE